MKIILLILLILGITCQLSNCQDVPDDGILYQTFLNWMDNYGVFYTSGEMQGKFQAWKENLLKIAELNAQNNEPDVVFTVDEEEPAALNARSLLAADPVITESYPSNNARFELNQYSDLSQAEFQSMYGGADASLAIATAAAVLSTGAIVGIAVGGAAALGAAGAGAAYVIKKKRSGKPEPKSNDVPMKSKPAGINIFNHEKPHHSITARAAYSQN
ncbi:hypothetical protein DICPUDRAFT_148112 [Dictyostelium purpureum]|uniref:Cathepsin propeptide inhibitor domain-containing protein n=1 Tax=Dictyostelium purpureum TaxID=5786 RepID=F0ZAA2_DICPU|nr:uncharacterized protein DICPUDRAFT_148112 [Dictyostelium purpureum]EGC39091.1 hypothetical protein DICPUDRAFT_148112 [Dictyostelium purpureum]|eukprot:XP_003284343.1 hypothetical protein DICPUDRAFT_148112 [Dictyostelium purpureum]